MTPAEAIVAARELTVNRFAGAVQRVACFARSLASRGPTNERAPDAVVRTRHLSCFGRLPLTQLQFKPPCPALAYSEKAGGHYCSDCGCGDGRGVLLDVKEDPAHYSKLHYPWLSCPRRQEGFNEPP